MNRRWLAAAALVSILVVGAAVAVLIAEPFEEDADQQGAETTRIEIDSTEVGRTLPIEVVVPADAGEHPPLVVFLHGRGAGEQSNLTGEMYAALAAAGRDAPVVAFPSGGESSYWHDRADGAWGRWVTDEVIPAVEERFGTDPERVAIGGISMGGFGALDLARLHPGAFCAVAGHSPALWQTGGETAEGAFDDAEDFAAHDVVGAVRSDPELYGETPVWIDAGADDPFQPGIQAFAGALGAGGNGPEPEVHIDWPGGHESEYWRSHWDDYMGFYTAALHDCR